MRSSPTPPADTTRTRTAPNPAQGPAAPTLPRRYSLRSDEGGWWVACSEAPNIRVGSIDGGTVSAASARRAPPGTIFVDGAAQGEPFLDVERGVYNLDHHEGCVRAFTLAACEQALVLVRKGLGLGSGEWSVVIGEPDLDTVVAVWVLLNHRRLTTDAGLLRRVVPVIRLEGWIDAHGLELVDLSGLSEQSSAEAMATIERLRARELELKRIGEWAETDPLEHLLAALERFDAEVYSAEDFADQPEIDELGRVTVTASRIAVVCRAEVGVYEVERHLRSLHGKRLAIVVLQKDDRTYTLRLVDAFLPDGLQPLYDGLNRVDPAVSGDNRWSGSSEIGGSPRTRGSSLRPEQVLAQCARVYRRVSAGVRLARLAGASAVTLATTVAVAAACGCGVIGWWLGTAPPPGGEAWSAAVLVALVALALMLLTARRSPREHGLRLPQEATWLLLLPAALLAGAAGGAWCPATSWVVGPEGYAVAASVALAAAAELLFRGGLHGWLAEVWRRPARRGGWWPTVPVAAAAALSAAAWTVLAWTPSVSTAGLAELGRLASAGVLLGLAGGIARERSGSALAAVALHVAAVLAAVGLASLAG